MSLREEPVVRRAVLPDGNAVAIRVIVPDDPYVPREQLDTVVVELTQSGEPLGVVDTPLSVADMDEAVALADRIQRALESGSVEPTAGGIEALASASPRDAA